VKKPFQYIFFALLSGLLLSVAWPEKGLTLILFVSMIPLLWIENEAREWTVQNKKWKLFGCFYLCFLSWNAFTTWWIVYSTVFGAVMAIVCNSLFMALVWLLFHVVARRLNAWAGYVFLAVLWISFEFLHYNWELTWPWLTLGNGFASKPQWIQWYEYTGVFGGSLWVLSVNIILFRLIKKLFSERESSKPVVSLSLISGALIILPLIFSIVKYHSFHDSGEPVNVVIVQPNVDPYNEKFSGNGNEQLVRMLQLASTAADNSTDYIIAPETALPDGVWENNLSEEKSIKTIRSFLTAFPNAAFVTGAATYRAYDTKETSTARKFKKEEGYFDAYNTALEISNEEPLEVYHKSKLVPGVERMPYPSIFGFLEKYSIDMGGTSGSLGTQNERNVFVHGNHKAAPVICYESIFGDFLSGYMRNGAQMIFIITNDGWWGNTPGYRQHAAYARIAAIEFRKSIARSANTGISCVLNQRGDILQPTNWWEEDVFAATIYKNDAKTFYARHGDYIAWVCVAAMLLLVICFFYLKLKVKTNLSHG
jgi:apolipoprotein N-acyltransferase